jgi:hypothetical protein
MKSIETINASSITSSTLVGVAKSKPPYKNGNCFSLACGKREEYRIVNFNLENLKHLLRCGLTWPVKISKISDRLAILHDERIPDEFYDKEYCEVCCKKDLLPVTQQSRIMRQIKRGQRIDFDDGFFIKLDYSKKPTLGLLPPTPVQGDTP